VRRRLSPAAIGALSVALLGVGWLLVGTAGTVAQIAAGLLVGAPATGAALAAIAIWRTRTVRRPPITDH
jgi:hypothetical protein